VKKLNHETPRRIPKYKMEMASWWSEVRPRGSKVQNRNNTTPYSEYLTELVLLLQAQNTCSSTDSTGSFLESGWGSRDKRSIVAAH